MAITRKNLSQSLSRRAFMRTGGAALAGLFSGVWLLPSGSRVQAGHLQALETTAPTSGLASNTAALIYDRFTGIDLTELAAHLPDHGGTTWTKRAGSIKLQAGAALVREPESEYTQTTIHSDGVLSCDFKCGAADGDHMPGLLFRGTDSTHYQLVVFSGIGSVVLYERINDRFNVKSVSKWAADTNWHKATVSFHDNTIRIGLDGHEVIAYTSLHEVRGTQIGVRGFGESTKGDVFDNFRFEPPDGSNVSLFPAEFGQIVLTNGFEHVNHSNLAVGPWAGIGEWTAQGGRALQAAVPSGIAEAYLLTTDVGSLDVALEMTVTIPTTGYTIAGFVFRFKDTGHYLELEINNSPSYAGWAGFGIWSYGNETIFTPVVLHAFEPEPGTTYTIRLRQRGKQLIAELIEAGIVMVGTSALFMDATTVGIFEARDAIRVNPPRYDNFVIRL